MSEQDHTEPASPPSPSRALVDARKALGLSQKEIADRLYLTTTFIRYIDDGEFDRLPKQAFIKGYLRSYAKAVGLSGDDIVAMYDLELEAQEPAPKMKGVTDEAVGSASITGPVMQTGVIGLVVFILVVLGIWYLVAEPEEQPAVRVTQPSVTQPAREEPAQDFGYVSAGDSSANPVAEGPAAPNESNAEEVTSAGQTATREGLPSGETSDIEATPVEGAAVEAAAVDTAALDSDATQSTDPEADISIERTSNGVRNFIKVDAGGLDQLELSFPDECWVEVEDDDRGLIYSDLNRPGDVLTLYGTAPFKLLLGKATGVEMLYNGRPFDLEPFVGQDQTAKVTVEE